MPSDVYFGGLQIHLYSVFFALGLGIAYFVALKTVRRFGVEESLIDSLALVFLITGIIGARLFYDAGHHYKPSELLQFWKGGLSFYGGLIGGFLGLFGFWFFKKFEILKTLDIFAPGLALGQAVGRIGNYFNREAFGPPTDLPWKMFVPENLRPAEFSGFHFFHPTWVYESLGLLIIFLLLWKFTKNAVRPGTIFAIYLVTAGILRFNLEFLRLDALQFRGLMLSQLVAILFILLGLIIFSRNASKAV